MVALGAGEAALGSVTRGGALVRHGHSVQAVGPQDVVAVFETQAPAQS
jgi:hypothetical protein